MRLELKRIQQEVDIDTGETTSFLLLEVPGTKVSFRALVTEETLNQVVQAHANTPAPPDEEPPLAPTVRDVPARPAPPPQEYMRTDTHEDGGDINVFGGEVQPQAIPSAARQVLREVVDPNVQRWIDPHAQAKAYRKNQLQAPPSRTVPMDDKGNPRVRAIPGGVETDGTVFAPSEASAGQDEDGVRSL
jgi:hypothetical protein